MSIATKHRREGKHGNSASLDHVMKPTKKGIERENFQHFHRDCEKKSFQPFTDTHKDIINEKFNFIFPFLFLFLPEHE